MYLPQQFFATRTSGQILLTGRKISEANTGEKDMLMKHRSARGPGDMLDVSTTAAAMLTANLAEKPGHALKCDSRRRMVCCALAGLGSVSAP